MILMHNLRIQSPHSRASDSDLEFQPSHHLTKLDLDKLPNDLLGFPVLDHGKLLRPHAYGEKL